MIIRNKLNKNPYKLWKRRKPNISYYKIFGCKCFILNTRDNLGKFDAKSDKGIFLGYSQISKAYRVFNKRTLVVEESMHVVFDEANPCKKIIDDEIDISKDVLNNLENNISNTLPFEHPKEEAPLPIEPRRVDERSDLPLEWKIVPNHPIDQILRDPSQGVTTR